MLRQVILALVVVLAISACEKGYMTKTLVALKAISACEKGLVLKSLVEELTVLGLLQFPFVMNQPYLSRHPPINRYCGGVPTQRA